MAADAALVQFRKLAGDTEPAIVPVALKATGQDGLAFFGSAGIAPNQLIGYASPPSDSPIYPVKAGGASWQVWVAARFEGLGFQAITNVHLFWESLSFSGLGTSGTFLASTLGDVDVTGIHMRTEPGPVELGKDPQAVNGLMPSSAPNYGLPPPDLDDGWLLFTTGPGSGTTPATASKTSPPEILDLTPTNPAVPPVGTEVLGKAILVSDQEPRYSNFGVMVLAVAKDATKGTYGQPAPFATLGLSWDES